jgi:hypothetical protein
MNPEIIEQAIQDYAALRRSHSDPDLEAVQVAILLEDLFDVTLPDTEIDRAVLGDASAVTALVARLGGTA